MDSRRRRVRVCLVHELSFDGAHLVGFAGLSTYLLLPTT